MRLIITADDFGYCPNRNRAIHELFQLRKISYAGLMVNALYSEEAGKLIKANNWKAGLHMNITEGVPVSTPKPTTLLNPQGFFLDRNEIRVAARNNRLDTNEVLQEMRAQIEHFRELTGNYPKSVDGHQHVHVYPGISDIFAQATSDHERLGEPSFMMGFAEVLMKYNIELNRIPVDDGHLKLVSSQSLASDILQQVTLDGERVRGIFSAHKIRSTDYFFGLWTMGSMMTMENIQATLPQPEQQGDSVSIEWMVHPGYICEGEGGCGQGPDGFSKSPDREHELAMIKSTELEEFLHGRDLTLGSFDEITNAN